LANAHDHRRNQAEKVIQTFKSHFIAILCGTDEEFPMTLWNRLLSQAEDTLYMLTQSKVVSKVSAFAYLRRHHNYNAQHFAPMGGKVEMYEMSSVRESWTPHAVS